MALYTIRNLNLAGPSYYGGIDVGWTTTYGLALTYPDIPSAQAVIDAYKMYAFPEFDPPSPAPASPDLSVQYNDDGNFGGFGSWNDVTSALTVPGSVSMTGSLTADSASNTLFVDNANHFVAVGTATIVPASSEKFAVQINASRRIDILDQNLGATIKSTAPDSGYNLRSLSFSSQNFNVRTGSSGGTADSLVFSLDSTGIALFAAQMRCASIGIGNSAAATVAVGALSRKIEVFDAAGASLGFLPIYTTIS